MESIVILLIVVAVFLLLQFGSKTYFLTPQNLADQLSVVHEKDIQKVYDFRLGAIPALLGGAQFYNGIKEIRVFDKNNQEFRAVVNNNTQIRITQKNRKRQSLYFDTMFIRDGVIYGNKSHFAKLPIKPVAPNEIEKVEIQFRLSKKTKV